MKATPKQTSSNEEPNEVQKREYRREYYRAYYHLNKDKLYKPKKKEQPSIQFIEKHVVINWD